ncbi:MAG: hypothetical protein AAFX04_03485 [Pseudomonadota bacterium]
MSIKPPGRYTAAGVVTAVAALVPSLAHADVVIGPRFSYFFDNSNLRTSSIEGGQVEEGGLIDQQALELAQDLFPGEVDFRSQQDGTGILAEQIAIPMVGAMINFGDDRDRFTITGMYGEGSGGIEQTIAISRRLAIQNDTATDFGNALATGEFDYNRYDLEVTWQRRTSERFAFFAGARYERLERSGPIAFNFNTTFNVDNLLGTRLAEAFGQDPPPPLVPEETPPQMLRESATQETFSIRAGVTAFVPFSETGTAFFNGMVHASYQPDFRTRTSVVQPDGTLAPPFVDRSGEEASFGPDIAVGAQFALSDSIALDVRYRAVLFFPLSGENNFSDARVNHGVNIGVSFRL